MKSIGNVSVQSALKTLESILIVMEKLDLPSRLPAVKEAIEKEDYVTLGGIAADAISELDSSLKNIKSETIGVFEKIFDVEGLTFETIGRGLATLKSFYEDIKNGSLDLEPGELLHAGIIVAQVVGAVAMLAGPNWIGGITLLAKAFAEAGVLFSQIHDRSYEQKWPTEFGTDKVSDPRFIAQQYWDENAEAF